MNFLMFSLVQKYRNKFNSVHGDDDGDHHGGDV